MRKNKFPRKLCAGFVLFIIAMGVSGGAISAADTNSTELLINKSSMVKNMEFNEGKDLYGISENRSLQTTAYQPTQWTSSDQAGYSIWHTEVNSGCLYGDHDFDIVVDAKPEDITDPSLTITAYDVDAKGADWCPEGVEVDKVYINDHYLGILTGADESWSTNTFHVDSDWIYGATDTSSSGTNTIHIDTDSLGTGCWCVGIGWAELKGKVGFQIEAVTPKDGAKNVDWENPEISVLFTAPYKSQTMNAQTFTLFYWGADGNKVYVDGTVEHTASHTATFKPSVSLKDGIYYIAHVWGKADAEAAGRSEWVKGPGKMDLKHGKTWSLWTMPDMEVTVVPVQVVENVSLIVNKPTVVKVFIRWDKKTDVAENWQVKTLDADIKLSWSGNDYSGFSTWEIGNFIPGSWTPSYGTPIKREYREFTTLDESYTKAEKVHALDSVNYYGFTPSNAGEVTFTAEVVPTGQTNTYTLISTEVSCTVIDTKVFKYKFEPVAVGDWSATNALIGTDHVNIKAMTDKNHVILKALYPLSPAHTKQLHKNTAYAKLYKPEGSYSSPATRWDLEYLLYHLSKLAEKSGVDGIVGVVPYKWLGMQGITHTELWLIGYDIARYSALLSYNAEQDILAHEFGHMLTDWPDENPTVEADEGFYVQARKPMRNSVNKLSGAPKTTILYNLMYEDIAAWSGIVPLWITKDLYNELCSELAVNSPSMMYQSTSQLLLASGSIEVATDTVTLEPWYILELGDWGRPSAGNYSLEFQDSSGSTLDSYAFQVSEAIDGISLFLVKVPYPIGTTNVLLKHGTNVILKVVPSANAPDVTITAPKAGVTWTGVQDITWTATDTDGDSLSFAVEVSTDGCANWEPLAIDFVGSSYSFDTRSVFSGANCMIKVTATDGFNTATQTVGPFTVGNPPRVVFTSPSAGETGVVPMSPVSVVFSEDMGHSSINTSTFYLEDSLANQVPGAVTYDSMTHQATFVSKQPLLLASTYTARVTTAVTNTAGTPLEAEVSWSFTTEDDIYPPCIVNVSPPSGAINVPVNTLVAATFDEDIDASSLTASTFTLSGGVSGSMTYDAASKTAIFQPSENLQATTPYTVTLTPGIKDVAGNALEGDYTWSFATGSDISSGLRCTGSYADRAVDDDSDGLYDHLIVDVGVEALSSGTYNLNGKLVDADGEEIEWAATGDLYLNTGVHTLQLVFTGSAIRSQGVDGPYTLTDLHLYNVYNTSLYVWLTDVYTTYAYNVSKFHAVLTLTGLPDITLAPGESRDSAFNLNDYAHHETLPDSELVYAIDINTDPRCGVSIDDEDYVDINIEPDWIGYSDITVKVTGGSSMTWDTFRITIDGAALPDLTLISEDIQFITTASTSTSSYSSGQTTLTKDIHKPKSAPNILKNVKSAQPRKEIISRDVMSSSETPTFTIENLTYPPTVNPNQTFQVTVDTNYSFSATTDIFVGIWDYYAGEYITETPDNETLFGTGSKSYTFNLTAPPSGIMDLSADACYWDGYDWSFTNYRDFNVNVSVEEPDFTIENLTYPATVNSNQIFQVTIATNYSFSATIDIFAGIWDRDASDYIAGTPKNETLFGTGSRSYTFNLTAPASGTMNLSATLWYRGDQGDGILSDYRAFNVSVGSEEPDFMITAEPASQTVSQGDSAPYTISLTSLNGFNSPVTLSVSGLPTGATDIFNPSIVTPSDSSTLTINTSETTPTGNYTLTITGVGDEITRQTTVALNITVTGEEKVTTISATIHNIGTADASNVIVQFFDGDPDAGGIQIGSDQTITSIPAGGAESVPVDWTPEAYAYAIYVRVDPFDSIQESSEENNIAFNTILLGITGDLNNDGEIAPADAVIALRIVAGSHPFDPATLAAADVNIDGQVTSLDALMILQAAAGSTEL